MRVLTPRPLPRRAAILRTCLAALFGLAIAAGPSRRASRKSPSPNANSSPQWIASGPDGALWFT
jgi:streptogramin lyase